MAEAIVTTVANKLSSYLLRNDPHLYGVRDEVEWLEREVRGILCFLGDAISKKESDEIVMKWVRDFIGLANDAEDVIETFMLETNDLTPGGSFNFMLTTCTPNAPLEKFMLIIGGCFPIFTTIVTHCREGREYIKTLGDRISDISERRAALGFTNYLDESCGHEISYVCKKTERLPHEIDESFVVGFVEDKQKILEQLMNDDKKLSAISVTGASGQGKTTFAKHIFDSEEIAEEFDVTYWISVPKGSSVPELLNKIADEVRGRENIGKLDEGGLKQKIHDILLSQERYLIVMDDLSDDKIWQRIRNAFPDGSKGSGVIFTTHHTSAEPSIIHHELSLLNHAESMELFLKKVYPNQNVEALSEHLKLVGQSLLDKCQDLPLAIIALGGHLAKEEKSHRQWLRVLNRVTQQPTNDGACSDVLHFCYEALPYNLKSCFLYMSSFPEDGEIPARRLMRLWIAEGFVPLEQHETGPKTAEDYLEDLVERSLVQVSCRDWDGSIKTVRLHGLLHNLCLTEAREYGFLNFGGSSDIKSTRRLALQAFSPKNYISQSKKKWKTPNLRTLLLGSRVPDLSLKGLKFLRVIDVEVEHSSVRMPKEIAHLIHLRYLRWGSFVNYQLIKDLHNLQTIHVSFGIEKADDSIGKFKDLQFLSTIKAGIWIENGLGKLTNLQKLGIDDIKDRHWHTLIKSLQKLHHLVSLDLCTYCDELIPTEVISIFSSQHCLRRLTLFGKLSEERRLPDSSAFPPNLTKLTLLFSKLKKDPMSILKELPNLTSLELEEASYEGKKMCCEEGGFPQLRYLQIHCLHELKDWTIENGTMPSLTHLFISSCRYLKMLPEGLQYVTTLQELRLRQMPYDFIQRIKNGEDLHKIAHIGSIEY